MSQIDPEQLAALQAQGYTPEQIAQAMAANQEGGEAQAQPEDEAAA
jgi:hypothetical protein